MRIDVIEKISVREGVENNSTPSRNEISLAIFRRELSVESGLKGMLRKRIRLNEEQGNVCVVIMKYKRTNLPTKKACVKT
jgi:hypothetical protein